MFARLLDLDRRAVVRLTVDGREIEARTGDSVAAAMLLSGIAAFRTTPISGVPRGPYCMMGVCFECLVSIDGQPNRQACMLPVRDGMRVERMQGARRLDQ